MIIVINDDLLNAKTQYIAHQTNCVSTSSAGIARVIFAKYPYANSYRNRIKPSILSTIDVYHSPIQNIINLNSQYFPGKPSGNVDTFRNRQKAFHKCLLQISRLPNLTSIAFNYGIGCGLAGGDWTYYLGTLNNFADYLSNKTEVFLYRKS